MTERLTPRTLNLQVRVQAFPSRCFRLIYYISLNPVPSCSKLAYDNPGLVRNSNSEIEAMYERSRVMHQSIAASPSAPPPARAIAGHLPPCKSGGCVAFVNFALPRGRAFASLFQALRIVLSPVSSRFIFVFALSQFSGPDFLGAWNRLGICQPRDFDTHAVSY